MLIVQGGSRLSLDLFTELPPAGFELGGGFGNAIVGTLVMVAIAAAISIPVGILAATYLAELSPESTIGLERSVPCQGIDRLSRRFSPASSFMRSSFWRWGAIRHGRAAFRLPS